MRPIPVKAQGEVHLKFRYPEGYDYYPYPGDGEDLWVTVDIEAPEAWDNTTQGIIGWAFDVHVDPAVLEPVGAYASTFGYYLYDFCDHYGYTENYPNILVGEIDKTTGNILDIAEFILGWGGLGVGAGGSSIPPDGWYGLDYGLVRLRYRVLQDGYSPIKITNAYYYKIGEPDPTHDSEKVPFDYVEAPGHYKEPVGIHDVTVTDIQVSETQVPAGEIVYVNVTVLNFGTYTEDFNVTAYYDGTAIDTKPVTGLIPGGYAVLHFAWDTTGVPGGTYTISATAALEGDEYPEDNTLFDGTVVVMGQVEGEVHLKFRYAEGYDYYPHQTGDLWVTLDIEAPLAWDNTGQGIVGWIFDVHVDPGVLEPVGAYAATFGYYLFDFCDDNEYIEHYPSMLVGEINKPTGEMIDVAEFILDGTTLGVGAGGNSGPGWHGEEFGLVRLRYNVLLEYAYSSIEITNAYYWTADGRQEPFDSVEDGNYNLLPVPEFPLGLPLEILFIPVIIYMLWRSKLRKKMFS